MTEDERNELEARFWSFVDEDQPVDKCWLWQGGKTRGYGYLTNPGGPSRAHRISYLLHCGEIPEGQVVMHICDEPACVNPIHLQLGSQGDNVRDAARKGRWMSSKRKRHLNRLAKLTEADVREIRRLTRRRAGAKLDPLAERWGVTRQTITHIKRRKTWRHVK